MSSLLNDNKTDPNKILPIRYPWARQHYKTGVANNWTPEEIPMQSDVEQWKSPNALTADEKRMILWNLGFFSTAESLTANNLVLAVYKHITDPACRQYLLRQAYEEACHSDVFIYCCDSLGLDPDEVYMMYDSVESIKAKDDFVVEMTKSVLDPNFKTETVEDKQRFIHDLVGFYLIMEGIFFYAGFAMILHLQRNQKMTGLGEQFQLTLRDESLHLAFGRDLINTIIAENPEVWTDAFKDEITGRIRKAVELEVAYAWDCLPRGILGMNASLLERYVRHIADRRLQSIGLDILYNEVNPFDWMSEIIDTSKEKNFFETRVTEYQTAGMLEW